MTEEQRRDDYERSCEYATRLMREREVRAGRLEPVTEDEILAASRTIREEPQEEGA
jgi:hypothetical protein